MQPSTFPQQTQVLAKPPQLTDEECQPLPVHQEGSYIISCWRPSWRERFALFFGRPLWVWVRSNRHPPIALETHNPWKGE